ncbi:DUF1311 domain-containing protein [Amylibacter sp. SFDW26]|uniref:lysozyme inhibitor LprI family protein n=1 Tax=Amylibacter sp. SFDW26 TaxID=2652722 RepID=UPI001261943F|nr:lysozyme inhibitor LprI family protein [Amylibacter sp. SFDW26]KAB7615623.1 DUF1311 domain-containing protein [Amylibacter sp. SFDW26]
MKPFPVLMILCGANMAAAQDLDCTDGGTTQLAMNICSYQAYQAADEDLNLAYQLARDALQQIDDDITAGNGLAKEGDEKGVILLRDAQRALIIYRDKSCAAEGHMFSGGSMRPLIENTCKESLTRQRTEGLRAAFEMN